MILVTDINNTYKVGMTQGLLWLKRSNEEDYDLRGQLHLHRWFYCSHRQTDKHDIPIM